MQNLLKAAFNYRKDQILSGDEIIRLSAGNGDSLPGLIIDKFGKLIIATVYNPDLSVQSELIIAFCRDYFPSCYVLVRSRENSVANSYQLRCSHQDIPPFIIANEDGLNYEIHFDAKHDFGIFRDAQAARSLLAKISSGKRILNLFAYTCAFGVVGAAHGAIRIVNVDPNKEYLTWAKKNAALNQVDFAVLPDTSQKFLARQVKKVVDGADYPFDLIITDPPAFGVGRGAARTLRTYWPEMLQQLATLQPKQIILLCNDRSIKSTAILQKMLDEYLFDYRSTKINHPKDVLGQKPQENDKWFQPPDIFLLER